MIQIKDKKDCCGCSACAQRCPKQCIAMYPDNEGFLYPVVDTTLCINCGLCEKVCPIINQNEPQKPIKVFAAYNKNEEVRLQSSSGGIFTLLAEETIKKGGVVFGVRFDNEWMPVFDYTEAIDGIAPFRGSKYAQATVGTAYKDAETFLKSGREVLFTGTPCQIAGLKKYLRKEYDNLLAVDIICHGVPSPKVWKMYLKETSCKLIQSSPNDESKEYKSYITDIAFRNKSTGWKQYSFLLKLNIPTKKEDKTTIFSELFYKNSYMRAFLNDTILRPSCYSCPAKQSKSHSDITIADFWGIDKIDPSFDDDKGCGLIFINTTKGDSIYNKLDIISKEKEFEEAVLHNSAYYKSCTPHYNRKKFFQGLDKTNDLSKYILRMSEPSYYIKIKRTAKRYIKAVLNKAKIFK